MSKLSRLSRNQLAFVDEYAVTFDKQLACEISGIDYEHADALLETDKVKLALEERKQAGKMMFVENLTQDQFTVLGVYFATGDIHKAAASIGSNAQGVRTILAIPKVAKELAQMRYDQAQTTGVDANYLVHKLKKVVERFNPDDELFGVGEAGVVFKGVELLGKHIGFFNAGNVLEVKGKLELGDAKRMLLGELIDNDTGKPIP